MNTSDSDSSNEELHKYSDTLHVASVETTPSFKQHCTDKILEMLISSHIVNMDSSQRGSENMQFQLYHQQYATDKALNKHGIKLTDPRVKTLETHQKCR